MLETSIWKVDQLLECFFFVPPPFTPSVLSIIFFLLRHSLLVRRCVALGCVLLGASAAQHNPSGRSYTYRQSRNKQENKNIDTQIIENRLFNVNCLNDEKSMRGSLFHVGFHLSLSLSSCSNHPWNDRLLTSIVQRLRQLFGAACKWWIPFFLYCFPKCFCFSLIYIQSAINL